MTEYCEPQRVECNNCEKDFYVKYEKVEKEIPKGLKNELDYYCPYCGSQNTEMVIE